MTSFLDHAMDVAIAPGFSRVGHAVRSRSWDPVSGSMAGRVVVITGATSGVGLAAARELAALGAELVLVGRNSEKAEAVRDELIAASGNQSIRMEVADLSLMSRVRELAATLLAEEAPIHVLINGAGALFPERRVTDEGIEMTLATDLLGHFLLTNLLIPRLVESAPARIINVSSGGMYGQRIAVDNLQSDVGGYRGAAAYARAKRGQVILTEMWADRLAGRGVDVNSMHPGWVDTPGLADSLPGFYRRTKRWLRTPQQGADTIVWLAASPGVEGITGHFFHDRRPRTTHRARRTRETPKERQALWDELGALAALSDE
jgi:dehydrogenase/reductase SDR family protein 12